MLSSCRYVIENMFDTAQIYAADGKLPKHPSKSEGATVDRYVAMYGEAMRNSTAQVLDEGIAQHREAKALERDRAVRRILHRSSKTLKDALGLREAASDNEVATRIRKLLRLLHPDFAINLALVGTEEHERIDTAFKKLNNLRL